MDSQTIERIKTLLNREKIDYSYLYQAAQLHLQMPLLYRNLSAISLDCVSADFMAKLQADFYHNSAWNLYLTDELTRLLCLFRDHEIPAIPFKGPVLAATVYGNLSLRVFSDLDVFVRKQDLTKIEELLAAQRYGMIQQTEKQKTFVKKHKYNIQFLDPQQRILIEIHWRFTRNKLPFKIDTEQLWKRAQTVKLAGIEANNFCPEDLLLLLCIHGAKHRWMRLGWLCDIAELIRFNHGLNWHELMRQAREIGVFRILLLGVSLVRDLLNAPVPAEVDQLINKDSKLNSLATNVKNYLMSGDAEVLYEEPIFFMKARERVRDKTSAFLYYLHLDASTKMKKKSFQHLPIFLNHFLKSFRQRIT